MVPANIFVKNIPSLISNCVCPEVVWHQKDNCVIVRIQLPDVKSYYVRVDYETLKFCTKLNDKNYFLLLNLCGVVDPEKTFHENLGREIKITLIKGLKWRDWPGLVKGHEKNLMIKADPDHIIKKSYDNKYAKPEEQETIAEFCKRLNITTGPPPSDSSGSDSDSDPDDIIGCD